MLFIGNISKRDFIRIQIITERQRGIKISVPILSFALLTFKSLPTFKKQVKKLEKYIMPIKPFIPNSGKTVIINTILMAESETAVRKEKTCWSSPFKIPSEILSIYISGTMGDNAFIKKPTSFSL